MLRRSDRNKFIAFRLTVRPMFYADGYIFSRLAKAKRFLQNVAGFTVLSVEVIEFPSAAKRARHPYTPATPEENDDESFGSTCRDE